MLLNFVYDLLDRGVERVIVGENIYRYGKAIPEDCPDVNYKINDLNRFLRVRMNEDFCHDRSLWRHKGLWNFTRPVYCDDGIHLNDLGNLRLYRSVRAALLKGIWKLLGF